MFADLAGPTVTSGDGAITLAAVLTWAIGGLVVATGLASRRGVLPHAGIGFVAWTGLLAAGLSVGAAAIHFAVITAHFEEWPPFGVAFAALAWFQIGWAISHLLRRRQPLAVVAIVVNAGAVATWIVSRTVGLPIGPNPGQIEPVGTADLLATGLEVALIGVLGWDLNVASSRWRPRLATAPAIVLLGSALLTVIVLTSAALAAPDHGGHEPLTAVGPTASVGPAAPSQTALPILGPTPAGGTIQFGSGLDLAGQITGPTTQFRRGNPAAWLAELSEPPAGPTVRFMLVQVLPDGREFEHWRQDVPVVDPGSVRLVGMADLWTYSHGGAGTYVMRYLSGDDVLAEGSFELVP